MSVTLNQAKFGTGVYGTAKYGQFIVDINLGVTATGTVASVEPQVKVSATAVTVSLAIASVNVTVAPTISATPVTASFAIATTTNVDIQEDVDSVSASFSIASVSIGNIDASTSGVSASTAISTATQADVSTNTVTGVSATGAINTVGIDNNLNTLTAVTASFGVMFNVESGLTLDGTLDEGELSGHYATRTNNIVHAGELTLPSSFTQTVPFWEHGGSGIGAWFGVAKISNVYYLRVRSGEGSTSVNLLSDDTDVVIANVPISQIPEFDGNTHTVVWDLRPKSGGRVRLWIDGRLIIEQGTSGGANLENDAWSGGNVGGWGIGKGSIAGGTTDSSGTQFQAPADRAWSGTIKSGLRYYAGELVSFDDPFDVNIKTNTITGVSASTAISTATQAIANDAIVDLTSVGITSSFAITAAGTKLDSPELTAVTASFVAPSTAQADIQQDAFSVSATGTIASVEPKVAVGISGVSANGSIGTVSPDINIENISSVSATFAIGDTLVARGATVPMTAVTAFFAVGSVGIDNVLDTLTAVTATGTANSAGGGVGTNTATGVTATGAIAGLTLNITEVMEAVTATGAIGTVEAQPSENTESATASIVAGSLTQVKVSERLQAVTASGAINTLTQVKTSAGLDTVEAQGTIASVGVKAVSPTLATVIGSFNVTSIAPDITEVIDTVSATGVIGTTSATGVQFDFEAVKELYDRFRTVYVEGFTQTTSERTVYVPRELRKVYVERFSTSAERRVRAGKAA